MGTYVDRNDGFDLFDPQKPPPWLLEICPTGVTNITPELTVIDPVGIKAKRFRRPFVRGGMDDTEQDLDISTPMRRFAMYVQLPVAGASSYPSYFW